MPQISEAKGVADMIDMTKKYQLKNGTPVRIYATDGGGEWPIIGAFRACNVWMAANWREDELVEVPETVVTWQNVYGIYDSRSAADYYATEDRVAVVRVERTGDNVQCFIEDV